MGCVACCVLRGARCMLLVYSHASCDEAISQLEILIVLYPEMSIFQILVKENDILSRKINTDNDYVAKNWRT